MYRTYNPGWIEVICGCMFAGKTEELIKRIRVLEYAKQNVVAIKPTIDNRYSNDEVVSHNKNKTKSINILKASDIYNYVVEPYPYAIVIDEVQFMDEEILDVCNFYANKGVRVICAGLDKDFRGEPFGIMPEILAMAEKVTKLDAICSVCGGIATRTQRIIDGKPAYYDDPVIMVGAKEQYEARCRHCHVVLKRDNNGK